MPALVLAPTSPAAISSRETSMSTELWTALLRRGGRLLIGRAPADEQLQQAKKNADEKSAVLVLSALPVSGRHCMLELDEVSMTTRPLGVVGGSGMPRRLRKRERCQRLHARAPVCSTTRTLSLLLFLFFLFLPATVRHHSHRH